MIYDPKTNAVDAVKMCSAAQSCVGNRRASLLRTAITDMKQAISHQPMMSDREKVLYSRYLTTAERMLRAMEKEQVKTELALSDFADLLHDATVMYQTALECIGTRRNHLVETARWDLSRCSGTTF